ncbi:MAG TPA: winged helix DNA-binding protein [Candidatus Dormibacteraeota bacterium]|nr:winged helix DNA-binding protein [Candidatus Dormibacteraeota bacterium]
MNHREWSAWLQLVGTFTLLPAALDSQLQREAGMTHFEFGVMVALSRQPDRRLQLKDLAVVANGSLSRLSHVISRLERRGWVRRTSGTKGRATYADLTDKGYQKLMATGPVHLREVRRLVFDVLTPEEVKALKQVTARINAGLLDGIGLGELGRRARDRSRRQWR